MSANETNKSSTNVDELKYLNSVREIFKYGKVRADRTGTGTIGLFGMQLRYNLRDGINKFF